LSQTAPSEEKGKKRKCPTEESDDSPMKKSRCNLPDSGIEDEHDEVKKKKKKKKRVSELAEESSNDEEIISEKPKKSKKKKKDKKGNSEVTDEVDFAKKNDSGDEMDDEKNYTVPKKKKKRDSEKNEIVTHPAEMESNSPRKKKRKKKKELSSNDCSENEKDVEQNDKNTFRDVRSGTPSTSRNNCVITDIYCPPDPEIITGELYNVVMYILNKNINVSLINTVWTNSNVPSTYDSREKMTRLGAKLSKFTEEEDACIAARIKFLVDTKVISDLKEFITQLNNQNGNTHKQEKDKATRNIVGLFLGRDLPDRLAHEVTQRYIFLATGTSLDNKYKYNLEVKRKQGVEFHIKQKNREWSMDEDGILIKNILKDKFSHKYIPVKQVDEKNIDWVGVSETLTEYGRTPQLVRERWLRTVKVILLEGDDLDLQQDRHEYRKDLLRHILNSKVTDRKEIRWKEVATHFYPKTSAMLSQDFWGMIKRKKQATLADKISSALEIMEDPTRKKIGRSDTKLKQREDMKSRLIDFYQSLPKTSKSR